MTMRPPRRDRRDAIGGNLGEIEQVAQDDHDGAAPRRPRDAAERPIDDPRVEAPVASGRRRLERTDDPLERLAPPDTGHRPRVPLRLRSTSGPTGSPLDDRELRERRRDHGRPRELRPGGA